MFRGDGKTKNVKVLVTRVPYKKIRVVASVRDKMFVVANHRANNNLIVSSL
jgi:hypothetical protein